ncbi:hypothetical protein Fcan01_05197 [Folsomia candida]|uniref:Uncharacterized protein n=1 Tax=Folsomia candida TaxID=158441 RepID=A0A226ETP1_FOLCA|nr:hypothetical protein Fcan01_05197 [Folsomia candida]
MKAPLKFYKSGSPSHINTDPTQEQNTAELLKWISDVTIKRRQIRRTTRCSNLFAEAILSSALRKAKKDLAHKQEEKRKKLRLFCLSRSKKVDLQNSNLADANTNSPVLNNCKNSNIMTDNSNNHLSSYQVRYVLNDLSSSNNKSTISNDCQETMTDSEADDEVKACLSSLESFFKELKSIKVKSSCRIRNGLAAADPSPWEARSKRSQVEKSSAG